MQRQIKFRVWNKKRSFFDNEFIITQDGEICCSPLGESLFFINGNDYVVQQFTGLFDKNNKEIYEGDVVKTDPDHSVAKLKARRESEECTEYTKGQVRWVNEGFMVCQEYIRATRISEYSACGCCPCGLEIIGNIFENPELL